MTTSRKAELIRRLESRIRKLKGGGSLTTGFSGLAYAEEALRNALNGNRSRTTAGFVPVTIGASQPSDDSWIEECEDRVERFRQSIRDYEDILSIVKEAA